MPPFLLILFLSSWMSEVAPHASGVRGHLHADSTGGAKSRSLQSRSLCEARFASICRANSCIGGEEAALSMDGSTIDFSLCANNQFCCLPDESLEDSVPNSCNVWTNAQQRRDQSWIQQVEEALPCPCTAQEAEDDNRFTDGLFDSSMLFSLYQPGALKCFDGGVQLTNSAGQTNWYGQQCCYGKRLTDSCLLDDSCSCSTDDPCYLIVEGEGAGTLDKRFPMQDNLSPHRHADLEPFEICTGFSSGFDQYTQYRPISNVNNCPNYQKCEEIPGCIPWIDLSEDLDYTARHECSFVQAGNYFFLFGGREQAQKLDMYDFESKTWSVGASPPLEFNHFQALTYQGLIWVIGSFQTNDFPNEVPTNNVYVYDPARNVWMEGPEIPAGRRRGGGGLQVFQGKFYLVGGSTIGHNSGFVNWFDCYDPRTGRWQVLPDAPHARDHFHAAVVGDKLYAAGGRRTSRANTFGDTISEVDVYDFATGTWLDASLTPDDMPNPRAAAATAVFNNKIILAGGESGMSSLAHDDVHALDPYTGKWEILGSMNYPRHGTQAIVSGNGIFVAAGSPMRGAGSQRNMEVYNENSPIGEASVAGSLTSPSTMEVRLGATRNITLRQDGGNQGIFVNSMTLTGPQSSDFGIISGFPSPLLIPNGASHSVLVQYTGFQEIAKAQLVVIYSSDQVLSVTLIGTRPPSPTSVPITAPTESPTARPTPVPTASPSSTPTKQPTPAPVAIPTRLPTPFPTREPSSSPSSIPTTKPTPVPSSSPSASPSTKQTTQPTPVPIPPVAIPTPFPTPLPTPEPSSAPSGIPTTKPTPVPSSSPSASPSTKPTKQPTPAPIPPVAIPTPFPTPLPTPEPSSAPSGIPTGKPTPVPSSSPSSIPTNEPNPEPSSTPSTSPSKSPMPLPTLHPSTTPSATPTSAPPTSKPPTSNGIPLTSPQVIDSALLTIPPTRNPSSTLRLTTAQPSAYPTLRPSSSTSKSPSPKPSERPGAPPSSSPSGLPSASPSFQPILSPSASPTVRQSSSPSHSPSTKPSERLSASPSTSPSWLPSASPTRPTHSPSAIPSALPTFTPSSSPTKRPTASPIEIPSSFPSMIPTNVPSSSPTVCSESAAWQNDSGPDILFQQSASTIVRSQQDVIPVNWKWIVQESTAQDTTKLATGIEVAFTVPFQLVLDASESSLECNCETGSSTLALPSFPLQVKLQLPTNSICQSVILAGGFKLGDACWRETISKRVASYFESETGRRQRECLQGEVNSAISTESKLTAEQVCMNGQIQPSSAVLSMILENVPKCGIVESNAIPLTECNGDTAPPCSQDMSQCCILEETATQVSIEQDVPFEAFGASIAVATISDLASTTGANAARFVLLASKATKMGGTMSTLGIFLSNDTPSISDIVRSITQHSAGEMLGGAALTAIPTELSIGDANFMPEINASPPLITIESQRPNVLEDTEITQDEAEVTPSSSSKGKSSEKQAEKGQSSEKNSKATTSKENINKGKSSKGRRGRMRRE